MSRGRKGVVVVGYLREILRHEPQCERIAMAGLRFFEAREDLVRQLVGPKEHEDTPICADVDPRGLPRQRPALWMFPPQYCDMGRCV